mmetsp:Transcript_39619/g.39202  ORF Transcript_39619/g.39202 Transcript_39619/m.39202 type:complete len:157 (-) Transcript_39619:42-512(-)
MKTKFSPERYNNGSFSQANVNIMNPSSIGSVPAAQIYPTYEARMPYGNNRKKESILVDSDDLEESNNPYVHQTKTRSKKRSKPRASRFNDIHGPQIIRNSNTREDMSGQRNSSVRKSIKKPPLANSKFNTPGIAMYTFEQNHDENQYNYQIPDDQD